MALTHCVKLCNINFRNSYFIVEQEEDKENIDNEEKEEDHEVNEEYENNANEEKNVYHNNEEDISKFDNINKEVKNLIQQNVEIDQHFPYKQKCHVYKTSQYTYDMMLNADNIYYKIQLLRTNSQPYLYYTWFRWGQTGHSGTNVLFGPENDPANCIDEFTQAMLMIKDDNHFLGNNIEFQTLHNNNNTSYDNYCNNNLWRLNHQNEYYYQPKFDRNIPNPLAFVGGHTNKSKNFFLNNPSKLDGFLRRKVIKDFKKEHEK